MAKLKFRRQFQDNYKGSPSTIEFPESITVPDMALTPREMIHNHTRGLGLKVAIRNGEYFDHVIPQIQDITDLSERRKKLREISQELDNKIRTEQKEKIKQNLEASEESKKTESNEEEKP